MKLEILLIGILLIGVLCVGCTSSPCGTPVNMTITDKQEFSRGGLSSPTLFIYDNGKGYMVDRVTYGSVVVNYTYHMRTWYDPTYNAMRADIYEY